MEPLFDDLLEYMLAHPECESVLVVKFESLLDCLPEGIDDLLQFIMHELQWPAAKEQVDGRLAVEENITRRARYQGIAEAFQNDWKHRDLYLRYDPIRDD
jgi:hypothetical protein